MRMTIMLDCTINGKQHIVRLNVSQVSNKRLTQVINKPELLTNRITKLVNKVTNRKNDVCIVDLWPITPNSM